MPSSTSCTSNCKAEVKTVLVIGNGPSAITLSYMLSGNVPIYQGQADDPMLHIRLSQNPDVPLVLQDIEELAMGCEGRSNNPVSVFFDHLNHPGADMGQERDPLLRWEKRPDLSIDHLVVGRGKPGGCWQSMEGNVQTVSLGNWMELPNKRMPAKNGQRAQVSEVAAYYEQYVKSMGLEDNFLHHAEVVSVREVTECEFPCRIKREIQERQRKQSNARVRTNSEESAVFKVEDLYGMDRHDGEGRGDLASHQLDSVGDESSETGSGTEFDASGFSSRCSTESDMLLPLATPFPREATRFSLSTTPVGQCIQNRYLREHGLQQFFDDDCRDDDVEDFICSWDPIVNPELFCARSQSGTNHLQPIDSTCSLTLSCSQQRKPLSGSRKNSFTKCPVSTCFPDVTRIFEVKGFVSTGSRRQEFRYLTKNLILATGMFDRPNLLRVPGENSHSDFVFHSLRDLEAKISSGEVDSTSDPILVVGAGLSAADAIIMAKNSDVSVIHVFRREVRDTNFVFRKLPPAMYPEYHSVFHMMNEGPKAAGGREVYLPLPGHQLSSISSDREVTLRKLIGGQQTTVRVSCVVSLTGSLPDLSFMEPKLLTNLGVIKDEPISKNNPVDIDMFSNEAADESGIYAMGPLANDNFVRFLQGGALAITASVLQKERVT